MYRPGGAGSAAHSAGRPTSSSGGENVEPTRSPSPNSWPRRRLARSARHASGAALLARHSRPTCRAARTPRLAPGLATAIYDSTAPTRVASPRRITSSLRDRRAAQRRGRPHLGCASGGGERRGGRGGLPRAASRSGVARYSTRAACPTSWPIAAERGSRRKLPPVSAPPSYRQGGTPFPAPPPPPPPSPPPPPPPPPLPTPVFRPSKGEGSSYRPASRRLPRHSLRALVPPLTSPRQPTR